MKYNTEGHNRAAVGRSLNQIARGLLRWGETAVGSYVPECEFYRVIEYCEFYRVHYIVSRIEYTILRVAYSTLYCESYTAHYIASRIQYTILLVLCTTLYCESYTVHYIASCIQ